MKKYSILIFSFLAIMLGCLTGCKSSKSATDSTKEETITSSSKALKELAMSYQEWDKFSTSGKISISGSFSFSTSMQLRMVRDKSVTISIRPVLGLEVAKVYIDNDSIVVVNKLNKVYTSIDLKRFSHILPMDISTIQDIFLSRVFSLNDGTLSNNNSNNFSITEHPSGNGYIVSPRKKSGNLSYQFTLNENLQLESLDVYPPASAKKYSVIYSDYATTVVGREASNIKADIEMNGKSFSLGMYMNQSKSTWNGNFDEYINIGKSYKKVSVSEFLSILKSI